MHQKICACGDVTCPAEGGGFYVTCVDGTRVGFLLGPFETHEEALPKVPLGRELAERVNSRAVWYGFGTVRYKGPGLLPAGKLNDLAREPGKVLTSAAMGRAGLPSSR